MRYLTDVTASPQLKRNSKVLSWISESEDMFDLEGAGQLYTSTRETESDGCELTSMYVHVSCIRGDVQNYRFFGSYHFSMCDYIYLVLKT